MDEYKCFLVILFGFLILKESSPNPLQNKKMCSLSLSTQSEKFPHVVLLRTNLNGEIMCRGTLIDVDWVLTSANCIDYGLTENKQSISRDNLDLVMGNRTRETVRKPEKWIVEKNNNVALIKMDKPVIVTSIVAPIGLAVENLSENMKCVVSSIRKTANNDFVLEYWKVLNVSKQTNDKNDWYLEDTVCRDNISFLRNITYNGTPLICDNRLYGMYSDDNEPRVFSNIFEHKKWISDQMDQNSSNKTSEGPNTVVAFRDSRPSGDNAVVEEDTDEAQFKHSALADTEEPNNPLTFGRRGRRDTEQTAYLTSAYVRETMSWTSATEDLETEQSADLTSADVEETTKWTTATEDLDTEQSADLTSADVEETTTRTTATEELETEQSADLTSTDTDYTTETTNPTKSSSPTTTTTTSTTSTTTISTTTTASTNTASSTGRSSVSTAETYETEDSDNQSTTTVDRNEDTSETEDGQTANTFGPTDTTDTSTPEPLPDTTGEATRETEDPTTVQPGSFTTDVEQTKETEDATPVHVETPPTTPTPTFTTTTDNTSTGTATTTAPTTTLTSTTTSTTTTSASDTTHSGSTTTTPYVDVSTNSTTKSTDVTDVSEPKETTTLPNEDKSSSPTLSFDTSLIAVLCILYYNYYL